MTSCVLMTSTMKLGGTLIEKYLDDLERRLDAEVEDDLLQQWRTFTTGDFTGDIFSPRRLKKLPPSIPWPRVLVNEALESYEMMALQQLGACSRALEDGSGQLLTVRSNYGTGIVPTMFGADLFLMDAEIDTLPTAVPLGGIASTHLEDSLKPVGESQAAAAVKQLLARGIPELTHALGGKVLEMAAFYQEMFTPYPKIQQYVHLYHPDMQGPMDICELLWGSSLFVALVEAPDLVTQLLDLVTDTYIAYMRAWTKMVPFEGDSSFHWAMMQTGNIMIRDDSAMNLSSRMFAKFIAPYDERLLTEFGGGAIHFCGRGDHYIAQAAALDGLGTINMSQPEYNDMDRIFDHTVDKGINIIGLPRDAALTALAQGRELRGRVHCW
ncbi:MAG: uroporphyrinogen decarboxylase family protein [Anaerolineae bacterium]|nr:uroporphyrinogen decarboxylase family protein [Anaerolineae bacterium]